MRAYNFRSSGLNFTQIYQWVWLLARVIAWILILEGVPQQNFEG